MSNYNTWGDVYDEHLDEMGDVTLGSFSWRASQVLKEMDPTAYRCGFADFTDTIRDTEYPCEECGKLTHVDDDVCSDDPYTVICEDCREGESFE